MIFFKILNSNLVLFLTIVKNLIDCDANVMMSGSYTNEELSENSLLDKHLGSWDDENKEIIPTIFQDSIYFIDTHNNFFVINDTENISRTKCDS